MQYGPHDKPTARMLLWMAMALTVLAACARMGQPDGGWYDETPPHIVSTSPADKSTGVKGKKVYINFDEFIKIENATENVVVSPPQMEPPEIKGQGKRIMVELKDTLKSNITYTIDFSDAITDNNEGNPLGNYTYSFSTGEVIDTMEVSGHVVDAETLEPVKGILVGLYSNLSDTIFSHEPMLRVSKTDGSGRFVIKGVAPGEYRAYALMDADGNFMYSQKSEMMAFDHNIIVPSSKPDIRQDTIWRDSLRIDSIARVPYTHFLPDDIVLRAFTTTLTDRYLVKSERKQANAFTLFFSYGHEELPVIEGLNFDSHDAFLVEANERRDTISYWLRDTMLVNQDTLQLRLQYHMTDSTGTLQLQTDTLELLAKEPYEKRQKDLQKKIEKWQKAQEKAKKRGEAYEEVMPAEPLIPKYEVPSQLDPDQNLYVKFDTPLLTADTSKIHLYSKIDTLWYEARFQLREAPGRARTYEIMGEWRPEVEYSLEIDSAAFCDIYGHVAGKEKKGFKVHSLDDYSSLFVNIKGMEGKQAICHLIDGQDRVVKQVVTANGAAEFYYIKPGTYYLRMIVDDNGNGRWDTGDFAQDRQPEWVYYYPKEIECKAKWDVTQAWDPTQRKLNEQKPPKLVKQRGDTKRTIKSRNAQRAKDMGILPPNGSL